MKKVTSLISLCVFVLAFAPSALADWPHDVKWDQLDPATLSMAYSWVGSNMTADDFLCDETGYITDIEFYAQPLGGLPETIRITFWSDVPAGPTDESHPGGLLADITVGAAGTSGIGWHVVADYDPLGVEQKFKINLPEDDWFVQDAGNIYWIGIQGSAGGFMLTPRSSSAGHLLDDAVFTTPTMPAYEHWGWDPSGALGRYTGLLPTGWTSADICFRLTGIVPEPASMGLVAAGAVLLGLLRKRSQR